MVIIICLYFHADITIVRSPVGSSVIGQLNNTYHYPLLSNITLTCLLTSRDNMAFTVTAYQWNSEGCYTNVAYKGGNPQCFPNGQTTANVFGIELTAEDAGTITCSAIVNGWTFTSSPLTLQVSGKI